MDRTRTIVFESLVVLLGSIAHIGFKRIVGIEFGEVYHYIVSSYLGKN